MSNVTLPKRVAATTGSGTGLSLVVNRWAEPRSFKMGVGVAYYYIIAVLEFNNARIRLRMRIRREEYSDVQMR